jgi:3-methylcrotonyl-CoA carboxylase alpha subunit
MANTAKQQAKNSNDPNSPWHQTDAWRLNDTHLHQFDLTHKEVNYRVEAEQKKQGNEAYYLISVNNKTLHCQGHIKQNRLHSCIEQHCTKTTVAQHGQVISLYCQNQVFHFTQVTPDCGEHLDNDNHSDLMAPMNGTMISILVNIGDNVVKGQPLLIMEAMKMEHTIKAPQDGTIDAFFYKEGEMVDGGSDLLAFSATEN